MYFFTHFLLPLLPALVGAVVYGFSRSFLWSIGICVVAFGAWEVFSGPKPTVLGPLENAATGFLLGAIPAGLMAWGGGSYVQLVGNEARHIGAGQTACVQAIGLALTITVFIVAMRHGAQWDILLLGIYSAVLGICIAIAASTGSSGGLNAAMALVLMAYYYGSMASASGGGQGAI